MTDLSTTTYGWVKPTVGADRDTWGTLLNTDLDSIDSTVSGVASSLSSVKTSVSQISSSLSGAISSTNSLSTGVSSSLSGMSSSLSSNASTDVAQSTSLSQVSSSLSGAISSTTSLSTSVSTSLSQISSSLSSTNSTNVTQSTSLSQISSSLSSANVSIAGITFPTTVNSLGVGNYSTLASDANKSLYYNGNGSQGVTVDTTQGYTIGTFIEVVNRTAGNTFGLSSGTLNWGSSTGTRTLGLNAVICARKMTGADVWNVIYAIGVT